jgi:predicted glycosyltransferase involved in capsule biosynthesis
MEGKGIFASSKSHLDKIGYYNEDFKTWGDEDWEMFFRFYKNGIRPHRTWEQNLIHHYHETKRPQDYKSIYIK